jgi:hypothetical protein
MTLRLKPRDACPSCGARSSRSAGLRPFRLSRPADRKCDACGKIFVPPTFSGDGIGGIIIGAALIANALWISIRAGLFATKAGTAIAIGMTGLGLAIAAAGIWSLLRCVCAKDDAVRGFDILLASSDSPKPTDDRNKLQ